MYTCPLHQWQSMASPCPACQQSNCYPSMGVELTEDAKKEFAPEVGKTMESKPIWRNTPEKKIFEAVCWGKYGQTFDTLCDNYGNNQSGVWLELILPAMSEWAAIQCEAKDEKINELTMENMTHEYNIAEAERFRPDYERQLLEEKDKEIKELREALEYLMEGVSGLPPLSAISGTLITHFDKAKQALNKQ